MNCPECRIGTIDKVILKKRLKTLDVYVCGFCESFWFNRDDIQTSPVFSQSDPKN